jgi:2,5-diamino-6-(ribosylamino)-4(3H)-pyrimidinone 5'-phosphate reductase
LIAEDPRLTVKSKQLRQQRISDGLPENPAKVGIISRANLPLEGKFLNYGNARVFIFTTQKTSPDQIADLQDSGVDLHLSAGNRVNLPAAMQTLKSAGINRLLLEGGGTLNAAMFSTGLIDEVRVYLAPRIFGGSTAPTLADGPGFSGDQAVHLNLQNIETLFDGGILITYLVIKNIEKR